jgi:hypothetical protein
MYVLTCILYTLQIQKHFYELLGTFFFFFLFLEDSKCYEFIFELQTTYVNGTMLKAIIPKGTGRNKTVSVTVGKQKSPDVTFFCYDGSFLV